MQGCSFFRRADLCIFAAIVAALVDAMGAAPACAHIICVDRGTPCHCPGVSDLFTDWVGRDLAYLLQTDDFYQGSDFGPLGDETQVTVDDRIGKANNIHAEAFVGVYPDIWTTQLGGNWVFGEYSASGTQGSGHWYGGSNGLAACLGTEACPTMDRVASCIAAQVDTADLPSLEYQEDVLAYNNRYAALVRTLRPETISALNLCQDGPTSQAIAYGIYRGVCCFFGTTSVGTSFTARPNGSAADMLLSWTESDPSRNVSYLVQQADACYGPWSDMLVVYAHDPQYTHDNINYSVDVGAPYYRQYYYRLKVVDEAPQASALSNGVFAAVPPGVPGGLQATVSDNGLDQGIVHLTWQPASGTTAGYYVYRSHYQDFAACADRFLYVGTVTTPAFVDSFLPTGVPLFYRVRAFNATAGGDLSASVSVNVPATVSVGTSAADGMDWLGPNPTKTLARVTFSVPRTCRVTVRVYDVAGRLRMVAYDGRMVAGAQSVLIDRSHAPGGSLAAGVFFVEVCLESRQLAVRRLVILD